MIWVLSSTCKFEAVSTPCYSNRGYKRSPCHPR
ncbi:hypothetical protein NC652_009834 [Populus alba x Populus x berolinensis]|nr:hypothetical protein NC652_009834 [Populus alba x Populus x berolinensis]